MLVDYYLGSAKNRIIYSDTTEEVIGTYVDNKPIYQKVFVSDSDVAGLDLSSLNIDSVVDLKGVVIDGTYNYHVPFDYFNADTYCIAYWYDINTKKINGKISISGTVQKIYLILQYTKTTD